MNTARLQHTAIQNVYTQCTGKHVHVHVIGTIYPTAALKQNTCTCTLYKHEDANTH